MIARLFAKGMSDATGANFVVINEQPVVAPWHWKL